MNNFSRRSLLKSIGTVPLAAALTGNLSALKNNSPNILFMYADDHATNAVSAYGGILAKVAPTPTLDSIAKQGMLFKKCYVTNSICAPCRAVIQTGKHSHLNGVLTNRDSLDPKVTVFPSLFQKAGYQTALVGKWHLKELPKGYDYFEVLPGQGKYYNPTFRIEEKGNPKGTTTKHEGYNTEITTDLGLKWLKEKRDKSKPFLMMLQYKAPHRKWEPGPNEISDFDDVTFPEPENLFDDYSGRTTAAHEQNLNIENTMNEGDLKLKIPGGYTDEQKKIWEKAYSSKNEAFRKANLQGKELLRWKYQRYVKDYMRCINSIDKNVARVLKYLDSSGLAKNTVVIYSADQGFYLGEHGWFDKRFMYEESFRTPLIVRWAGKVKPGTVNTDLVQNLDFAQTMLDIAGIDQPSDMQGMSFRPLLLGKKPSNWRKSLFYHYFEFPGGHSVKRHEGVATQQYKLIHFYDLKEWEFFDLKKDPAEMKSEFNNPEYASKVKELKKELDRLKKLYKVPPPPPLREKKGKKKPKRPKKKG